MNARAHGDVILSDKACIQSGARGSGPIDRRGNRREARCHCQPLHEGRCSSRKTSKPCLRKPGAPKRGGVKPMLDGKQKTEGKNSVRLGGGARRR